MASGDITRLVQAAANGDEASYEELFARVYDRLKRLARRQLHGARTPTLDTTSLVHDVYLKLACPESLDLSSRQHFFALAARAMRQVVMDHARALAAAKRGNHAPSQSLESVGNLPSAQVAPDQLLALDRELNRLAAEQPRMANLIELRFFAGFDLAQIAELQQVSERTLARDWRRARAELCAAI